MYLFLNQTIKQEALQLLKNVAKFCSRSTKTTPDTAINMLSTDSQSRIFRIVPEKLVLASRL